MEDKTIIGLTTKDKVIFIVFAMVIGAVAGAFIKILAKWAAKVPFIPFTSILERISEWDASYAPIVGVIIGMLAGVVLSIYAFNETLHVIVRDDEMTFTFQGKDKAIPSSKIGTIYMENKILVVLDRKGKELYRGKPEAKRFKVADALRHHDYPWEEQDPYANQYQRWVPEHPDFPDRVNVLLKEREKALKDDDEDEAEALRKDLTANSVVIKDEKKRQYVRIVNE